MLDWGLRLRPWSMSKYDAGKDISAKLSIVNDELRSGHSSTSGTALAGSSSTITSLDDERSTALGGSRKPGGGHTAWQPIRLSMKGLVLQQSKVLDFLFRFQAFVRAAVPTIGILIRQEISNCRNYSRQFPCVASMACGLIGSCVPSTSNSCCVASNKAPRTTQLWQRLNNEYRLGGAS
eukprot:6178386-Pleurochrysis_carterae.AAC.5